MMPFEMDGIEQLLNKFERLGGNVEAIQGKIVNGQSDILLEEQKRNIRVDTGKTRDSLDKSNVRKSESGGKYKLVGACGKCDRKHIVRFLERGCAKWKGKKYPFQRISLQKAKPEMIEYGKNILLEEIKKNG